MADDIDDLLNEVEDKYLNGKKQTPYKSGSKQANKSDNPVSASNRSKPKSGRDDINSMIDDIFDDGVNLDELQPRKSSLPNDAGPSSQSSTPGTKKCFPVYIGGSICPQGLATAVQKRCCDRLRCTDCDFCVSTFENFKWDSTVDYLFLRNNIPDFDRLKSKLTPMKGSRAYACQCKWKTIREQIELQSIFDVKWFCAKH